MGGSPIPLVVTTAGSVIGNLTKNLESYRRRGGSASEAVLATSRPLTARQRSNLERRAREFGFTLRQIHDQAGFRRPLVPGPGLAKGTSRPDREPASAVRVLEIATPLADKCAARAGRGTYLAPRGRR